MKDLTERVVRRHVAASELDEKMKALLLKLRKGADASLSLPQLFKVLALLGGWKVEEVVGLAPIHYDNIKHHLRVEGEQAAREGYAKLKSHEVSNLPSSPKLGQSYVMDLGPFQDWDSYGGNKHHGAEYKVWVGVPCFRITDPDGHQFDVLPSRHDISRGSIRENERGLPVVDPKDLKKRLRVYEVLPWLKKETSYLDQINGLLGMDAHNPNAVRTRDNTGTCGACLRNIKLVAKGNAHPTMALHGYNRPGYGYVVGKCLGGEHPPYELSTEATKIMLASVTNHYNALKKQLDYLEGSPDRLVVDRHGKEEVLLKSVLSPDLWAYELKDQIRRLQFTIRGPEADLKAYTWLVQHWELRDLPEEGVLHIDWYIEALKRAGKSAAIVARVISRGTTENG